MSIGKIRTFAATARLLLHTKRQYDDGAIVEMRIWQVPASLAGSQHTLKYSLFYGREGQRLVGYDNERGKGDHRHYEEREEPYSFSDAETLMADFLADVERLRGAEDEN